MAIPEQNGPEISPRRTPRGGNGGGVEGVLQRFRELPRPAQVVIGVALFGILYMVFSSRGEQPAGANPNQVTAQALAGGPSSTQVFNGLESDRPVLMQSWLEQSRRDMASLKDSVEKRFQERDSALAAALQQNAEMQRESRQMMADFTAEIKSIEAESQRNREQMGQLADEQKKIQLGEPVDGTSSAGQGAPGTRRDRINQTPLGSAGGPAVSGSKALLAPVLRPLNGGVSSVAEAVGAVAAANDPLPFMPPLGFIKATMLNGVDALVGGQASPALVRLHGSYRTAMNTTVNLDGCLALVEFQGDVSTERAVGKPARMTCVYPDLGAVTYSLSGYVVDAEDGIIGVPGVFYEGDASRIAAAMLADFAAGLSEAIEQNQQTTNVGAFGNTTTTLTGGQTKSEIAGGVSKATKSLRDYLMERVNRVLPFIRLDATRELHIVMLSGVELRHEGSPWTLLFDGEAADQSRASALNAANNANINSTNQQPANAAVLPPAQGGQ
ncbi:MAG TPA: TrbI/VirB10 family protein [Alphaproteobacteria bacterium]|nr:TrbI/VirB10 family protein [Alphaproteobacteria bacterium]